ncbi:MAG: lactate dehydrogenase [Devosia sp.]|uniref:lactate/malate family dehydrogenase n=1 Tax=Devosia sp. TaxID=1871048 RepID=UPI00260BADA0|nr:NAD(P)-binding domain-containing protein [Devosia sp.]MDB5541628.1 lactate dehydrogenase [Devosia sp.]
MKIGIVGMGTVGSACALAAVTRGTAREIVLVNRTRKRAEAIATDMGYGTPLTPATDIRDGDYDDLAGAAVVMITAGVNEKTGGATDRNDPAGRLRLLEANVKIFEDIVPQVVRAAPDALLLVVTDPPDALADRTRRLAGHDRVLSTGTYLDSLRFRVHLGHELGVSPAFVEAQVIGEHGTSEVFVWSSARVAGVPLLGEIERRGQNRDEFRKRVEAAVRYANITIIEGNNASQYGVGIVSVRIAEMILRDEKAVVPIGSYHQQYGATLSLPSIVGSGGVTGVMEPDMSDDERQALQRSADTLRRAERRG